MIQTTWVKVIPTKYDSQVMRSQKEALELGLFKILLWLSVTIQIKFTLDRMEPTAVYDHLWLPVQ